MNKQQFTEKLENTLNIISKLTINHSKIRNNKLIIEKLENLYEDLQEYHGAEPKHEFYDDFLLLEDQIKFLIKDSHIRVPHYSQEVIELFADLIKSILQIKWEMLSKINPIIFVDILLRFEVDEVQKPFVEFLCKRSNITKEGLISFLKTQQKRVHSMYGECENMVVYDAVIELNIRTVISGQRELNITP